MIAIIRISGMVNVPQDVRESLARLNLGRKYTCVMIKPTKPNMRLLNKIRNFVAYGDISEETLKMLIDKRAESKSGGKIDTEKVIGELEKKSPSELPIKPFFRLHPPRGGIDAKKHFGVSKKAVLGDNKDKINDLIRRML